MKKTLIFISVLLALFLVGCSNVLEIKDAREAAEAAAAEAAANLPPTTLVLISEEPVNTGEAIFISGPEFGWGTADHKMTPDTTRRVWVYPTQVNVGADGTTWRPVRLNDDGTAIGGAWWNTDYADGNYTDRILTVPDANLWSR